MKDIHDIVRQFAKRPNESFALATLVRARGSSYRRPGARMLIDRAGKTVGSLSGGCLEEEVAQAALRVLQTAEPILLSFDTRRRFGCNGAIDIFVERAPEIFLRELVEQHAARREFSLATHFDESSPARGTRVLAFEEQAEPGAFVQKIHPEIRLILFGDGPDSVPLRTFAETLGWEVSELNQASELPSELDDWSAVLVKSHNYGRDYAALQQLLPRNLRYVGLIGPRARRDQLLGDLLDHGVALNAELFAPAGLELGAEGPEEIALAIVSEIQRVFTESSAESLRSSKQPIHGRQAPPLHAAGFQPAG